jgi:Orf76 (Ac76)
MERWLTMLVYFVLILAIILAGIAEIDDLHCPTGDRECGIGKGCAYYHGKAESFHDLDQIISRTRIAVRYDQNSVKWRRCLIISGLIGLILIPLLYGKFGDGREIIIIVLTNYIFIYLMVQFFADNLSKHAAELVDQNLKLLSKKRCLKESSLL